MSTGEFVWVFTWFMSRPNCVSSSERKYVCIQCCINI